MIKNIIRRRIYFMPKSFQGKYIFYYFLLSVLCVAVFTIIFGLVSAGSTSIVYDNYNLKVGATPVILIRHILVSNWVFILVGGIIIGIVTMFLMHRIAGPFYRFNMILKKMINGDFTGMIVLRKHDEGKAIADKFNELNRFLAENMNNIKLLSKNIEDSMKMLEDKYRQDETLKKVSDDNSKISGIVCRFKTD